MRRNSRRLPLGAPALRFRLLNTASGRTVALEDFASSPALLVAFLCNHCPFVKHILDEFVAFARDFEPRGLAVIAISSNDVAAYPADSPAEMARIAASKGFTFPYLYDETQEVAKAYEAVCTPDFFLFDRKKGHCEYFASAFAVLARAANIPTRTVNGFLGGEWNEYRGYVAVRAGDAHSWDEVYFPGSGWVTFAV